MLHPVRWIIIGFVFVVSVGLTGLCLYWIVETRRRATRFATSARQNTNFATCALEAGMLTRDRAARIKCVGNNPCVDLDQYFPPASSLTLLTNYSRTNTDIPKKIWQPTLHPSESRAMQVFGWTLTQVGPKAQRAYLTWFFSQDINAARLVSTIECDAVLADLWTLAIMYDQGGLAIGRNMVVQTKPHFTKSALHVTPSPASVDTMHLFGKGAVRHDLFAAPPNNPVLSSILGQVLANLSRLTVHEDQRFLRLYNHDPDSSAHRRACATGEVPFSFHALRAVGADQVLVTGPDLDGLVAVPPSPSLKHTPTHRLVSHESSLKRVPAIVHLSWTSRDKVPQKVWDHLGTVIPGSYDVRFYDNQACEQYILDRYGPHVLDLYLAIPQGAHRADTFRYAVLYHDGGIWLDIKTIPNRPIDQIFDRSVDFTTALTPTTDLVYQGVLSAVPALAMLHECFFDSLKYGTASTRLGRGYTGNLAFMVNLLKRNSLDLGQVLRIGYNHGRRFDFVLLEERVTTGGTDRYGLDSQLYNDKNDHVAKTRYDDFPWSG